MKKISVIGAGNMGKAIIGGLVKSETVNPDYIIATNRHQSVLDNLKNEYGVQTTLDSKEGAKKGDIIIFAVKPKVIKEVIKDVKEFIDDKKIIVSIAAGISIEDIESVVGNDKKIIKVMPNTPAMVGEAMSAVSINKNISEDEKQIVMDIFKSLGKAELVDESLMDAVTGVSGSSPAYVYMMIESMADAAVLSGMPRKQAYVFASQAVLGAAKMVLETGLHPGELKDMVCSPSGTTIEAVEALEKYGFRNAVIKGQMACVNKSIEMSKK
ncbi:pyrroline-5-carboxylate reductase [Peptostreptococcus faecalis]|uniref:pyrroline-5-carboxylate reductase n=1 Tax=Peptostreptococcus faecalis TaxID=2045015 RepID=UPI000C7B97BF|nr:pyrroline-5-carboxylate reductase [Peptostreptococcus faecalis]